ncbi:phosphoribosylanthranilate isomerase [Caulobacter sp. 17J65-9]|uniref:phosphoribosylanthranilate isomerase n=1 Tax=Caulobacter sp. 17J65-9 TaxID=2709382 RepID=UPI0013C56E95|nr:phosphoribosylanthranilate isomerase [Caulobacter sp. 17J65-9]NEX92988.1 phosphoribosylanthranilate isomerase [Caulobacter sp. 17J65-9]
MTLAKICGLSTPEAVRAAVDGRAAHLGFVFFPKSPRNLAPEVAARLVEPVRQRGGVKVVAVMVDPSDAEVDAVARTLRPDLIQLHGAEKPPRVREIAARSGAGIIKAVSVSDSSDVEAARAWQPVVEHLMFDAKPPKDSDLPGGVGARFDWTILSGRRFDRPWFLAGGLDPWNVADAVSASGAPMVDVSSGVERGPGLKDPALIKAFLEAVGRI